MTKYYFLMCALPKLEIKRNPDMYFEEFDLLLDLNLTDRDKEKLKEFRTYIDIQNIKAFWQKKPLNKKGNLTSSQMEEALLVKDFLPGYVFDYMNKYSSMDERIKFFPDLLAKYFADQITNQKGFLKKYFLFEKESRLILTALRAKKYHFDIAKQLQFEDFYDFFVAYILAQKDAEEFIPPDEYQTLKGIFQNNVNNPAELDELFLEYKFTNILKLMEEKPFTIDQILAYTALYYLILDHMNNKKEEGMQALEDYIKQ